MTKFSALVEMYTTPTCPYCMMAKSLLDQKQVTYEDTSVLDPKMRQDMMQRAHGRRTVPQIFINNQHIGGFDDLSALERGGKLDALLVQAHQ